MDKWLKRIGVLVLSLCCLLISGCEGSVGVGMSVSAPVGSHGRMHVSGGRWF